MVKHLQFVLIALFAVLVLSSSILTPTFEAPDENAHYYYIQYLWLNRTLPVLTKDVGALGDPRYQSYQPPGYYLVALIFAAFAPNELSLPLNIKYNPYFSQELNLRDNDNKNRYLHTEDDEFPFRNLPRAVHISRLASVALAVLNALASLFLARAVFISDTYVLIFLALTLFIPGYVFIGGVINTDNSVALAGTLIVLLCWRLIDNPTSRRSWIALALAVSYTTISKVTTLGLFSVVIFVQILTIARVANRREMIANVVLHNTIWLVLTSWMFIRNFVLYGDVTGVKRIYEITGEYGIFSLDRLLSSLPWIGQTFIGRLASQNFPMPDIVYSSFAAIMLVGVFGWLWHLPRSEKMLNWLTLFVSIAGLTSAIFYNAAVNTSGAQGRYLYPVLGAVMAIVVKGLLTLLPIRFHKAFAIIVIVVMPLLSAIAIYRWLPDAYKLPPRYTTFTPPSSFQPLDYRIGENIQLRGISIPTSRIAPGDTLTVTLYWETLRAIEEDYVVFLQVVDSQFNKAALKHTLPGLGMYQPTRWRVGEVIADAIPLRVNATANAPNVYSIIGGLLGEKTGERLPMTRTDYKIGEIVVVPQRGFLVLPSGAHEMNARFEQGIQLKGCSLKDSTLVLYWQADKVIDRNYKIFTHLWDDQGQFMSGLDHAPMQGSFPTRYWQAGDWVEDEVKLTERKGLARVTVGFYSEEDQQRLPLIEPASPDQAYSLPINCWK